MMSMNNDNATIDEKKLKRMLNRIYVLERENSKTNKHSTNEMVNKVCKIIEEEAKKCY